jgi:hypothetical protein
MICDLAMNLIPRECLWGDRRIKDWPRAKLGGMYIDKRGNGTRGTSVECTTILKI